MRQTTTTPFPRSRRPRRLLAAAAGLVLLAAAGCGGGDDPETPEASASATEDAGYLPVPDGVTLTEPGTEVAVGEGATVAWEPREGTTAVLDLTVDRIERTTFDDSFEGWQIDAKTAAMTPYFVRATATNVGDTDLGGVHVLLWGQDDSGQLIDTQRFKREVFEPCPSGDLPKKFAVGAEAQVCFVYLIAAGRALDAVAFPPPAGLDPVLWRGDISTKVKVPKAEPTKKAQKKKAEKTDEATEGAAE